MVPMATITIMRAEDASYLGKSMVVAAAGLVGGRLGTRVFKERLIGSLVGSAVGLIFGAVLVTAPVIAIGNAVIIGTVVYTARKAYMTGEN